MRSLTFLSLLYASVLAAGAAAASDARFQAPDGPAPRVAVALGPDLQDKAEDIGQRDLDRLTGRLQREVEQALARDGGDVVSARLVLVDARPNRPTFEQVASRPGLDAFRSVSIGGARIEGEVTTADGVTRPVSYDWYSSNLADVRGFGVWDDADRAIDRFARRLADGRN
ncbi:MAG TPA: hypothetical protein VGN74_11750 [Brevundimonas sp.]|jgi:hypothetical protein|uniref:hypothetical protein n=1 Tax=Brevundimonas sp. TaxID=1871086 RepID=UPI002E14F2CE|nr:hypothetical protein [Brevundimonas sp.]